MNTLTNHHDDNDDDSDDDLLDRVPVDLARLLVPPDEARCRVPV